MPDKIKSSYVCFHYGKQHRVILEKGLVNPRNKIGKMGILRDKGLAKHFHRTVCVRMKNSELGEKKNVHLRKGSLIKWINAQVGADKQLARNASKADVVAGLKGVCKHKIKWTPEYHAGQPSEKKLHKVRDKVKGSFWNTYWNITLHRWSYFMLRFKLTGGEKFMHKGGEERAHAIFWKTYKRVPAYHKHVDENSAQRPRNFSEIPLTDKETYIKPYVESNDIHETLLDGNLPDKGQSDTSTGTSGKPTPWVRNLKERETIQTLIHYATKAAIGDEPIFFINTFAQGQWATGVTTTNAMIDRAMTFSANGNMDYIFNTLAQFPPDKYPGRTYAMAGYPPFLRDLVIEAKNRNFDLTPYKMLAVVGGEGMSDGTRKAILAEDEEGNPTGFANVMSSYGASDLDINIGYQTDFEVNLRKKCQENPKLAAELFGANELVPMIFHYDPLNYYIESNEDQQLIFTCGRTERASPRVRYNLKDRGKVMRKSDVMAILKKHGIDIVPPRTNLPFLFIWAREGTATFRGCKIPHDHLQNALESMEAFQGRVKNYAFNVIEEEDEKKLELWVELREGEKLPKKKHLKTLRKEIVDELMNQNQDFKYQMDKLPKGSPAPKLVVYKFNESPMSNQDKSRKRKYVYNDGK